MITHRSFTGPTRLLSANVRRPVSFAVPGIIYIGETTSLVPSTSRLWPQEIQLRQTLFLLTWYHEQRLVVAQWSDHKYKTKYCCITFRAITDMVLRFINFWGSVDCQCLPAVQADPDWHLPYVGGMGCGFPSWFCVWNQDTSYQRSFLQAGGF